MPQIIVALDNMDATSAMILAEKLSGRVWGFKVNDLLLSEGVSIVKMLHNFGLVMCDPKLLDIPNTVATSIRVLDDAGANIITVHPRLPTVRAAVEAAKKSIIAVVTVLTCESDDEVIGGMVRSMAGTAIDGGAPAVVCPPPYLDSISDMGLKTICPGVRLPEQQFDGDDQKLVGVPKNADWVVIGRPIVRSKDPLKTLEQFQAALA